MHPMRRVLDILTEADDVSDGISRAARDLFHDPEREDEAEVAKTLWTKARALGIDDEDAFVNMATPILRRLAEDYIASLPRIGGKLVIYRTIRVPADWTVAKLLDRPLGVFWAHRVGWNAGTGDEKTLRSVALRALAEERQINWYATVLKHLTYDEAEVRIKDDEHIILSGVLIGGRWRKLDQVVDVGERGNEWLD